MEVLLQQATFTIWERNLQLALFGLVFGLGTIVVSERDHVLQHGFFSGYSSRVWGVILLQSLGGMATAGVLKYTDSIMKCVAKSLGVVAGSACSRIIFGEGPRLDSFQFLTGLVVTLGAVTVYSLGSQTLLAIQQRKEPGPSLSTSKDRQALPEMVGMTSTDAKESMALRDEQAT